jgi:hypothetical protein
MDARVARTAPDFLHVEYPQIRLPLAEPIAGIVVRAEVFRQGLPSSGSIEHPAQPYASTTARCTPKPTMRRVHWSIRTRTQCGRRTADSHRNRSRLHRLSFARPRAMSQDGPAESGFGRYRAARMRHTTSLLIGIPKAKANLLRDPWTTPGRISLFHVDDGGQDFLTGSLWARLPPSLGREQQAVFPLRQRSMEAQER